MSQSTQFELHIIMGVLLRLLYTAHAVSRDIYTDITEGFFLLQLPRKSQLLASGGSVLSLTQSRLKFVSPASPL
ncbi:hypothetical protein N7533_008345 [Penicillium manginii]|uniref:uncharacterized protein n=1 Tax=Penicillium manginii TaxID=203109 RepID=UPI002548C8BC|nr:uncharacterized protein N7533_008345 [Penicillium manginii]KAJ5751317.1 hypothetical protein N7533_008345 [Penicillium manginii]